MDPEISDSIGRWVMIASTNTTIVGMSAMAPRFSMRLS